MDLLWGMRERPSRGPKPVLSVERIAQKGVEIADAEGLSAVTMQRVAAELDFTKMALYRHTAGKEELIAVMIEVAVGIPPKLVEGGWRSKLEQWALALRETWQQHPWLPSATVGERPMGPQEIGWTECALAALEGTRLNGPQRMNSVLLVSGHLRNTHSAALAGTQPWTTRHRADINRHPELFPALIAAIEDGEESSFEFGLGRILDGLSIVC